MDRGQETDRTSHREKEGGQAECRDLALEGSVPSREMRAQGDGTLAALGLKPPVVAAVGSRALRVSSEGGGSSDP